MEPAQTVDERARLTRQLRATEEQMEVFRGERDTARTALATVTEERDRMRSEIARYRGALSHLLLSADAAWEDRGEGHDWREACEEARALLDTTQ